jgi:hypothetical protein
MMHVCLHDSFSVNYACDFAFHQIGRSRWGTQGTRAIMDQRVHRTGWTHILRLPPGSVVTFTNLRNLVQLGA